MARQAKEPVTQLRDGVLWAVIFGDHIHTDRELKLAVFWMRKNAARWIKAHGTPECRIRKLTVS